MFILVCDRDKCDGVQIACPGMEFSISYTIDQALHCTHSEDHPVDGLVVVSDSPDRWTPLLQIYSHSPTVAITTTLENQLGFLVVGFQEVLGDWQLQELPHTIELAKARKVAESQIRFRASHDSLTGLYNRQRFLEHLGTSISRLGRHGGEVSILLLDLDKFKPVNDTYGHQAGDLVLRVIGDRLKDTLRTSDVVGRLGGDEFAIILESGDYFAQTVASKLIRLISVPVKLPHDNVVELGVSIGGLTLTSGAPYTPQEALKLADTEMYKAKQLGGNRYSWREPSILSILPDKDNLELILQPIVWVDTSPKICGFEALLRWGSSGKLMRPEELLPTLDDTGRNRMVGGWVLDKVLDTQTARIARGESNLPIHVNLAHFQLSQEFAESLHKKLVSGGVDPGLLVLELNESIVLSAENLKALEALKSYGIKAFIDDFGSGHGTWSMLWHPFDGIKISSEMTQDNSLRSQTLCRCLAHCAESLGIEVIADGVSTQEQANLMGGLGIRKVQGLFVSTFTGCSVP